MKNFESGDLNNTIAAEEKVIAAKLRDLRVGAGISCAEFADALSIEPSELQEYEDGVEAVPASIIALVCALSGTPYEHFFGGDDEGEGDPRVADIVAAAAISQEHAVVLD